MSLVLAVSPYHLTGREPAAMVSCLLADAVVSVLPTPGTGREAAELAAREHPHYAELVRRWSWSLPLWDEGVVHADGSAPGAGGASLSDEIFRAGQAVHADDRLAALRPLMEQALYADEDTYLGAIARDLLRGGPDPALSVPLAAGLDRFAARNGIISVRSDAVSVAQRAEKQFTVQLARFGMPVVTQCDGERLVEARTELKTELEELRHAVTAICRAGEAEQGLLKDLAEAARVTTQAFESAKLDLLRADDPDDERVLWANATLSLVRMPCDAVLRSSALAARAMSQASARTAAAAATLPAPSVGDPDVYSLIVRIIGRPTA